MDMEDHVLPIGLVDSRLARAAPRLERGRVIGVNADDVEAVGVDEIGAARIGDAPAEDEMKERLAHAGPSG